MRGMAEGRGAHGRILMRCGEIPRLVEIGVGCREGIEAGGDVLGPAVAVTGMRGIGGRDHLVVKDSGMGM